MVDEAGQAGSTLRFLAKNGKRFTERSRDEQRRRGREDERTAAIDEEIAENSGPGDDRAAGPQGFSAGVQHEDGVAALQFGRETPSLRPIYTGRVGLIDRQGWIGPLGWSLELGKRGPNLPSNGGIRSDPRRARSTASAPGSNGVVGGRDIVVRKGHATRATELHSVMRAGVHVTVVDDQVFTLRQRRQQGGICGVARAE